jgi:CRP-like cAMP-binding protein
MDAGDFKLAFPKLARRLGDRDAGVLITLMREREVPAGATLMEDRALASSVFLVVDGEFRVEAPQGDDVSEIGRAGPGHWIGEIPLFCDEHISSSRVAAMVPSRVLELPHAQFWSARMNHPELVSVLTRELVDHMSERVRTLDQLITRLVQQRESQPGPA